MCVSAVVACGPELTTPASSDITGSWFSADTAALVTDFQLELLQGGGGELTGSFSAVGVPVNGQCPPEVTCAPANVINGSNTVFQVYIDFRGVGVFTGQVAEVDRFRGHMQGSPLTFRRRARGP